MIAVIIGVRALAFARSLLEHFKCEFQGVQRDSFLQKPRTYNKPVNLAKGEKMLRLISQSTKREAFAS